MRNSIFFACFTCLVFTLNAQTNNTLPTSVQVTPLGVETPAIVTNRFNIDHSNNDVIWQKEGDNYTATYTDPSTNNKCKMVYDEDGNMISKDKQTDNTVYPKTIGTYYTKHYPNENYTVWISEDKNGTKTYYTTRNSSTLWFDKNGKYITTKSKEITDNN